MKTEQTDKQLAKATDLINRDRAASMVMLQPDTMRAINRLLDNRDFKFGDYDDDEVDMLIHRVWEMRVL